jgi:hypothetical protein
MQHAWSAEWLLLTRGPELCQTGAAHHVARWTSYIMVSSLPAIALRRSVTMVIVSSSNYATDSNGPVLNQPPTSPLVNGSGLIHQLSWH